jgi:choline dehydrogenase-like flavoprotein
VTAAFDVAVVGSGPSGALAAAALVRGGARVLLLDVAHDDDHYRQLIPDLPFSEIRRTAPEQRRFFLGDRLEGVPSGSLRVGAQLTPPRQFVTRDADAWLPTTGDGFEPMQTLALGGLGAAWGAACFTYSEAELRRIGIFEPGFGRLYDRVAAWIGVSADPEDDASRRGFAGVAGCQPPLEIDAACGSVWQAYRRRRDAFLARGLALGRTPLAVLSRDLGDRRANPYFDMDFWSESRRSVFRPRYLIEALEREPGFRLERGCLVQRFALGEDGVEVACRDVRTGAAVAHRARRLVLCAGAIGSARIALHSLALAGVPVPMLSSICPASRCAGWGGRPAIAATACRSSSRSTRRPTTRRTSCRFSSTATARSCCSSW